MKTTSIATIQGEEIQLLERFLEEEKGKKCTIIFGGSCQYFNSLACLYSWKANGIVDRIVIIDNCNLEHGSQVLEIPNIKSIKLEGLKCSAEEILLIEFKNGLIMTLSSEETKKVTFTNLEDLTTEIFDKVCFYNVHMEYKLKIESYKAFLVREIKEQNCICNDMECTGYGLHHERHSYELPLEIQALLNMVDEHITEDVAEKIIDLYISRINFWRKVVTDNDRPIQIGDKEISDFDLIDEYLFG